MNHNKSLVESMIDSIVSGDATPEQVVGSVMARDTAGDRVSFAEGEQITCPDCGSHNLEEGFVESEDGDRPAYSCKDCGTVLIAEDEASDDDSELVEAEIDEENPVCPACNSDALSAEVVESDGEQNMILTCGSCHTRMVVVD